MNSGAFELLLSDTDFIELLLPKRAEILMKKLQNAFEAGGSLLRDIDGNTKGTAASLRDIIIRALKLKVSVAHGPDTYNVFFVRLNTALDELSMNTPMRPAERTPGLHTTVDYCLAPGLQHKSFNSETPCRTDGRSYLVSMQPGGFKKPQDFRNVKGPGRTCIKASVALKRG